MKYYRITKPDDTSEGPSWDEEMDQYDGILVPVERFGVPDSRWTAAYTYLHWNDWLFDIRWLTSVEIPE